MKPRTGKTVFLFLLAGAAGIGLLHALTPGHMIFFHDTYRRLSYFPIAVGAVFFGLKGGMTLAVVSCLAFIPHLLLFWARGPEAYYSELLEIFFYLAAGGAIGFLSSRETRLREKYRLLSEKLAASYNRLHSQAERLVEAESQLSRSRKLSMLGHVSASLAHEIKNPLAAIRGATEILSDEFPPGHPKHEFMDILRTDISRLNRSVETVLDYCRGQQNETDVRTDSLNGIFRHVLSIMTPGIREKSLHLDLRLDAGQGFEAEADAMIQVLMNILLNAVDAVSFGGRIRAEILPHADGRLILISDDGPGIPEEEKESVFQSFVTFREGGTGLGLPISKRIMERLGGDIRIDRPVLGGATFCIFLPERR